MSGDHQHATSKRDADLRPVRWEPVALKGSEKDARQSGCHQTRNLNPSMGSKSPDECDASDERNSCRKTPMHPLLRRKKMHQDRRHRQKHRGQQTVDDAQCGCPNAYLIGPCDGIRFDCWFRLRAHDVLRLSEIHSYQQHPQTSAATESVGQTAEERAELSCGSHQKDGYCLRPVGLIRCGVPGPHRYHSDSHRDGCSDAKRIFARK
jgi:hypothetical protein